MALQSMRFRDNHKTIDFSEKFDGYDFIRISAWNDNTASFTSIDLEKKHILELINWLEIQVLRISETEFKEKVVKK